MLKVTLKFILYCVFCMIWGCSGNGEESESLEVKHYSDSLSETRIDSAYKAIRSNCDTLMIYQVPKMVDSFLKDSALAHHFFDNRILYVDADKKVEKITRQLLADCDSNLLKETYRIARLRQKQGPVQRKKLKASPF
jgi:hypothetical protein